MMLIFFARLSTSVFYICTIIILADKRAELPLSVLYESVLYYTKSNQIIYLFDKIRIQ